MSDEGGTGARNNKKPPKVLKLSPAGQVIATAFAGILLVASILWALKSKQGNILGFSLFLLLMFVTLLGATLTTFANRRLLRVMKTPSTEAVAAATAAATAALPAGMEAGSAEGPPPGARSSPLPPPLNVRIFDLHTAVEVAPAVAARAARGRQSFTQSIRIWRQGVWFLGASIVVVMILALAAGNLFLPILTIFFGLMLIMPAVRFGRAAGRSGLTSWSAWYQILRVTNSVMFPVVGALALLYIGGALLMMIGGQPHVTLRFGQSAPLVLDPTWVVWCSRLLILAAIAAPVIYRVRLRRMGGALRRSVLAERRLKLLYLWVFAPVSIKNIAENILSPAWHFTGPIQFLRGAEYMAEAGWTIPILTGRADRYVLETPKEVTAALESLATAPNWLGMYPTNTLLCADSVWQLALEGLLADTDAVLMNLCSFSRERRGCTYELGELVDHLPTRCWLLLIDWTTDMDYLQEALAEAWASMALDSPNRGADVAPVQLFRLSSLETAERGIPTETKPAADVAAPLTDLTAEANRMFEILCQGATAA